MPTLTFPKPAPTAHAARKSHLIVIAGNPNSGKSTLFNALTGLRQKIGNNPGVTVEKKIGRCAGAHGEPLELLDLPGTYSVAARSPDEAVARDVLLGRRADTPAPDVILCVVDATNLERNLYLVAQLAEIGRPLVVALTMIDLAEQQGIAINCATLGAKLGCPVVPVVASQGHGLVELRQALTRQLRGVPPHRAPLPAALEDVARTLGDVLVRGLALAPHYALPEALLLISPVNDHATRVPAGAKSLLLHARQRVTAAGLDPLSAGITALCLGARSRRVIAASANRHWRLLERPARRLAHAQDMGLGLLSRGDGPDVLHHLLRRRRADGLD